MQKFNLTACLIAMLCAACGEVSTNPPEQLVTNEGVATIPLISTASNGDRYRLTGAVFIIEGPRFVILSEADTAADEVSLALPAGAYTIRLEGDWRLERIDPAPEQIPAVLVSPNPLAFSITGRQTQHVRFVFKVPGEGTVNIGFSADTGGWFRGTMYFTGGGGGPLAALVGQEVPFLISYDTSTINRFADVGGQSLLHISANSSSVQFGGPHASILHDRIGPALSNVPFQFGLTRQFANSVATSSFQIHSHPEREYVTLDVSTGIPFGGVIDDEGFPTPQPFEFDALFDLSAPFAGGSVYGYMVGTGSAL
ncbi:hypothetical protein [Comamonas sp. JC664]|uniref:hypothetical protein n=1 Tax=Comamonas sp. JC664 TaxID=2801917 RepID=UPI00174E14A9|nr:hypothetical protein [Comamonas sp. JC664]MBL0694234.1 hypothetical protein [Comamonas sp. JC664]GHG76494.1 hypothetical protein GCM10012319_25640 [Comamonas sp. KCTC 72670]